MSNLSLIRFIDRWLGSLLCFFLSVWLYLFGKGKNRGFCPPRRFLFIELSEMGSPVLAFPAMDHIRKNHPDAEIHFLIFSKNRASVDLLGIVPESRVMTISTQSASSFILGIFHALSQIRSLNIDTVFDMELFSRFSALLAGMSRARNIVGFSAYHNEGLYRGSFWTHPVLYNCHQHMSKNFLALVKALDHEGEEPLVKEALPDSLPLPGLRVSQEDEEAMRDRLARACPLSTKALHLVLFNPGAGVFLPIRAWPVENYAALGRKVLEQHDAVIVLIGLEDAKPLAPLILRQLPSERCADMVGKTTMQELMALLSLGSLLVTADSGPAHFSTLTQTPSVVLFGPETPALYSPLGDHAASINAGLSCSPCLSAFNHRKTTCQDPVCMRSISVDQVFSAVLEKLAS